MLRLDGMIPETTGSARLLCMASTSAIYTRFYLEVIVSRICWLEAKDLMLYLGLAMWLSITGASSRDYSRGIE